MEIGRLNPVRGLRGRRPGKKGRSEEERQAQVFDLPVIREMQIQVRMRCCHQPARIVQVKITDDTKCRTAWLSPSAGEVPVGAITWASGLASSDKVKNVQAPRAAIPLLSVYPRDNLACVSQERSMRRF